MLAVIGGMLQNRGGQRDSWVEQLGAQPTALGWPRPGLADGLKLEEMEGRLLDNTNRMARDKYGIEVVSIGIHRMAYPTIVANAVYNRMRAEREKEAMKYRAEGKEEAAKIEAQTDREVSEILAGAYKESEIIKAEGDKRSMKIYAGLSDRPPTAMLSYPANFISEGNWPPKPAMDNVLFVKMGDLTMMLALLPSSVPVRGPALTVSRFSGSVPSAPGGTSSQISRVAMPTPPM